MKLRNPPPDTAHTIEKKVPNVRHRTDCVSGCLHDLTGTFPNALTPTTWTPP